MKYRSKYVELGFYVNEAYRQFRNHTYVTADKDEIAVLDRIVDAERIDEPNTEESAKPDAPKAEGHGKPAVARKPSAK